MKTKINLAIIISIAIGVAAYGGHTIYRVAIDLLLAEEKKFDDKIALIQKQIATINEAVTKISGENSKVAISLKEIQNRQDVREKSQSELLTEAVAKVAPAVVSIVISKDVPQLEVVYQNPFGNDPFPDRTFQDHGTTPGSHFHALVEGRQ